MTTFDYEINSMTKEELEKLYDDLNDYIKYLRYKESATIVEINSYPLFGELSDSYLYKNSVLIEEEYSETLKNKHKVSSLLSEKFKVYL